MLCTNISTYMHGKEMDHILEYKYYPCNVVCSILRHTST